MKNRLIEISENASRLIIVQPNPTYEFPVADAYLYKKFEWGEPITIELDWTGNKQYRKFSIHFIEDPDFKDIEILNTTPIFCDEDIEKVCYAAKGKKFVLRRQQPPHFRGSKFNYIRIK